jgi:pyrroline-5-carboxylate reductase
MIIGFGAIARFIALGLVWFSVPEHLGLVNTSNQERRYVKGLNGL